MYRSHTLNHYYFSLLFIVFIAFSSCIHNEKDRLVNSVFVFRDAKDTTTFWVNRAIMELPEYKTWGFNYMNSDTLKILGYAYFEQRKIEIDDSIYYHIEFFKKRNTEMIDSYIAREEIVCYFRVYPLSETIWILDTADRKFIDLMSKSGRKYFQDCLTD